MHVVNNDFSLGFQEKGDWDQFGVVEMIDVGAEPFGFLLHSRAVLVMRRTRAPVFVPEIP